MKNKTKQNKTYSWVGSCDEMIHPTMKRGEKRFWWSGLLVALQNLPSLQHSWVLSVTPLAPWCHGPSTEVHHAKKVQCLSSAQYNIVPKYNIVSPSQTLVFLRSVTSGTSHINSAKKQTKTKTETKNPGRDTEILNSCGVHFEAGRAVTITWYRKQASLSLTGVMSCKGLWRRKSQG